jgi:hypothetical protein
MKLTHNEEYCLLESDAVVSVVRAAVLATQRRGKHVSAATVELQ